MVLDPSARHHLQVANQSHRIGTAVGLHNADDNVGPLLNEPLPFLQHPVGLAHAGRKAEIDLEPAALLLANQAQKMFRIRP